MQSILCSPHTSVFVMLLLYAISFVLLVTPGVLACVPWLRRKALKPSYVPLIGFGVIALGGYLFFWVFLASHAIGKLLSFGALILLVLVYLDPFLRKVLFAVLSARDILIPYLLIFVIGLFYTAVAYIGYFDANVCAHDNVSFIRDRLLPTASPDYLIQRIWVDKLFAHASPWNIVLDPDLSRTTLADRPPVLAGIALMFFTAVPQALEHYYFMAITTVASLSWIAAIWVIAREVKLSSARSVLFVLALSQTFYFYYSSIFTWPKALSGALFIGAFCMLALGPLLSSRRASGTEIVIGSAFAGLSILTHNSTMLLLLPLGLLLLVPRLFPGIRASLAGAAVFALITIPYMTVKSLNDPSLSNQTKYTLSIPDTSPAEPAEYKSLSIREAITKAYSAISLREIVDNKLYNIASIFRLGCFGKCDGATMIAGHWGSELLPIAGSMKLFNLGWLLFVPLFGFTALLYGKQSPHAAPDFDRSRVDTASAVCAGLAAAGLLIYALASFRQGVSNILSSGFMLLLFTAAGLRLFALRPLLASLFFLAQVAYFQWITVQVIAEDHRLQLVPAMVLVYIVSVLALIALPARLFRAAHSPS